MEDWCEELEREVFSELEAGRPLGVFIEDPKLGLVTMLTGTL